MKRLIGSLLVFGSTVVSVIIMLRQIGQDVNHGLYRSVDWDEGMDDD